MKQEKISFNRSIASDEFGLAKLIHHSTSGVVTLQIAANGYNGAQEISLDVEELEDLMTLLDGVKWLNNSFVAGEHPQDARIVSPIILECNVNPETKSFYYYDLAEEKVVRQYVPKGYIKVYCPDIDYALKAVGRNKHLIISYTMKCNKLVVGENFNY